MKDGLRHGGKWTKMVNFAVIRPYSLAIILGERNRLLLLFCDSRHPISWDNLFLQSLGVNVILKINQEVTPSLSNLISPRVAI